MALTDELERLDALRRDGTLTDEEFARAKEALLGGGAGRGPRDAEEDGGAQAAREERQWAMFVHLSLLAGLVVPLAGYVLPIVLWQVKKESMPGIDAHGRVVVNWLISSLIYWVAAAALAFVIVGIPLLLALGVLSLVFPIVGAVKANEGALWRYPLSIRFL